MMFGYIVLYTWPLVVFAFFRAWSPPVALLATIIGGYLLLPTQLSLELPGFPSLNKDTIPAMSALFATLIASNSVAKASLPGWLPQQRIPLLLLASLIIGSLLTVLTNRDPLFYGPLVFPPLRLWDVFSTLLAATMMLLPLFLGRKFLARPEEQILALKALVIAGAGYSLLALYEIRMSPQLNIMVYGFFPHAWEQHIRGGGYRPVVFVHHGLWLAIFFAMSILAAAGLGKHAENGNNRFFLIICLWLTMTLLLSNSFGAFLIAVALLGVMFFFNIRMYLMVATFFAGVALLYPMLRGADLIPVDAIINWVQSINVDRANSLEFRLNNENYLLEKARERPFFGWGGWGRGFVYDPATGEGISLIADGYWVGAIGLGGWARYLSEFGLLCVPILMLFLSFRRFDLGPETAILSLVLVANVVDLLPNATATPITWLLAGALWGRLEIGKVTGVVQEAESVSGSPRVLARTRPLKSDLGSARDLAKTRQSPNRYTRQSKLVTRTTPKDRDHDG